MMRINNHAYHSLIEAALNLLPENLANKLREVDTIANISPIYIGLHDYTNTDDGRSYLKVAHVVYPFNQLGPKYLKKTTIVLPNLYKEISLITVVHELGHVAHEIMNYENLIRPIDSYAEKNQYEAFACAFTMHYLGERAKKAYQETWDYREYAPEAVAIFDSLERII